MHVVVDVPKLMILVVHELVEPIGIGAAVPEGTAGPWFPGDQATIGSVRAGGTLRAGGSLRALRTGRPLGTGAGIPRRRDGERRKHVVDLIVAVAALRADEVERAGADGTVTLPARS